MDHDFQKVKECVIEVAVTSEKVRRARLVIHQNLAGPASRVNILGKAVSPPSDSPIPDTPDLPDWTLYTIPRCSVIRGGALSGADNLTIFVAIRKAALGT